MRMDQLSFFLAIVEAGSINKASKNLHTAQQNVSKSLKQMEDELGYTLLDRTKYGMCLTVEGREFLVFADHTINQLNQLKDQWQQRNQTQSLKGSIELAASMSSGGMILSEILPEFKKSYPLTQWNIRELDSQKIFSVVANGDYHLGMTIVIEGENFTTIPPEMIGQLNIIPIHSEKLTVLVSKNSPLAQQKKISMQNVLCQPLGVICKNDYQDHAFYHLLIRHGTPNIVLTTGNKKLCIQGLVANNYVTLVPESSLGVIVPGVHHLHLSDGYTCTTNLVYRKDVSLSELEKRLVDFILSAIE